jgi:predicted Fe-S protein YdhL (DUF1289 family)
MKSPCNKTCKIENNSCIGCGRTLNDIKIWASAATAEQQTIIKMAKRRLKL